MTRETDKKRRCANTESDKPVVDVARDAQCCVHTRDSSCRGQTHGQMDGQTLCDNKG